MRHIVLFCLCGVVSVMGCSLPLHAAPAGQLLEKLYNDKDFMEHEYTIELISQSDQTTYLDRLRGEALTLNDQATAIMEDILGDSLSSTDEDFNSTYSTYKAKFRLFVDGMKRYVHEYQRDKIVEKIEEMMNEVRSYDYYNSLAYDQQLAYNRVNNSYDTLMDIIYQEDNKINDLYEYLISDSTEEPEWTMDNVEETIDGLLKDGSVYLNFHYAYRDFMRKVFQSYSAEEPIHYIQLIRNIWSNFGHNYRKDHARERHTPRVRGDQHRQHDAGNVVERTRRNHQERETARQRSAQQAQRAQQQQQQQQQQEQQQQEARRQQAATQQARQEAAQRAQQARQQAAQQAQQQQESRRQQAATQQARQEAAQRAQQARQQAAQHAQQQQEETRRQQAAARQAAQQAQQQQESRRQQAAAQQARQETAQRAQQARQQAAQQAQQQQETRRQQASAQQARQQAAQQAQRVQQQQRSQQVKGQAIRAGERVERIKKGQALEVR